MDEELAIDPILNHDVLYWIGLSDLAHWGTWRWQETHQIPEYFRWGGTDPNGGTAHNCGQKVFLYGYDGKWADWDCATTDAGKYGPSHALCQLSK